MWVMLPDCGSGSGAGLHKADLQSAGHRNIPKLKRMWSECVIVEGWRVYCIIFEKLSFIPVSEEGRVSRQSFENKIIIITGGSMGIGLATAEAIARQGGSLCLIARRPDPLARAQQRVQAATISPEQFVETLACDVTDESALRPLLDDFIARRGVPDVLINAVGYSYPQRLARLTLEDFRKQMEVNYFGQLIPTLMLLPHWLQRGGGHVSFVSSVLGYMSMIGFAGYAPTKYALFGLAETLRHELKPHGVSVSILFPPDTDTPGFERENLTKPPESAKLSEAGKLMTPEAVAQVYVAGLLKGRFEILPGEAGWIRLLSRLSPRFMRWYLDRALRKLGRDEGAAGQK